MLHSTDHAQAALDAAPPFPRDGAWTPLRYTEVERSDAAYSIALAIREHAYMLTALERSRLGMELVSRSSTDHAHRTEFDEVPS